MKDSVFKAGLFVFRGTFGVSVYRVEPDMVCHWWGTQNDPLLRTTNIREQFCQVVLNRRSLSTF